MNHRYRYSERTRRSSTRSWRWTTAGSTTRMLYTKRTKSWSSSWKSSQKRRNSWREDTNSWATTTKGYSNNSLLCSNKDQPSVKARSNQSDQHHMQTDSSLNNSEPPSPNVMWTSSSVSQDSSHSRITLRASQTQSHEWQIPLIYIRSSTRGRSTRTSKKWWSVLD